MTSKVSLTQQIEELEVGESHVRAERLPLTEASDEAINTATARVRNGMNQLASRLRRNGKGDFRVESLSVLSPDRQSVLCLAVTTRVEEEEIDI